MSILWAAALGACCGCISRWRPPAMWQVLHGELGDNPLETLAVVAQDVFMPLLTSPANQEGWPDVVAKEVTDNMHKFVSNGAQAGEGDETRTQEYGCEQLFTTEDSDSCSGMGGVGPAGAWVGSHVKVQPRLAFWGLLHAWLTRLTCGSPVYPFPSGPPPAARSVRDAWADEGPDAAAAAAAVEPAAAGRQRVHTQGPGQDPHPGVCRHHVDPPDQGRSPDRLPRHTCVALGPFARAVPSDLSHDVLKANPDAALKVPKAYPGPNTELDFWTERAANLNSIHDQLCSEKIQKVVQILELAKSTYYPAFERLFNDVKAARTEANSNVQFLQPLRKYFEKLEMMDDFTAIVDLFKPVVHMLLLVWRHSDHYNSATRMTTIMVEICNDLIMQANKFLPGADLIQMEPTEAVEKLRLQMRVLANFKQFYFEYREKSKVEVPDRPWKFQNSSLFQRLDTFLERSHDMMNMMATCVQFNKLERVEIGGTKGKVLTNAIKIIHQEFTEAVEKFRAVEYDVMDTDASQFDDDFYTFRVIIKELERRLAAIIIQAFDDCTTIGSTFKLLDSFEGLLEREVIAADLEKKNDELLDAYYNDLRDVQEIFHTYKDRPIVARNAAPYSGAVAWVRGLVERIEEPMIRMTGSSKGLLETEKGAEIQRMYDCLMTEMNEYQGRSFTTWCDQVAATSDEKLNQPLLRGAEASPDGAAPALPCKLCVNFDPDLVRLLRETKYFLLLKCEVPESALLIFQSSDEFRQQISSLDLICTIYNRVSRGKYG
eukprot:365162-Chlamydomonas_euryale.AAC.21